MMLRKVKNQYGETAIIVILILIVIVLAVAIIIPIMRNASEKALVEADEEYMTAANRMAMVDRVQKPGDDNRFVYDSVQKRFAKISEIDEIEEYTSSKEYAGKYIVVTFSENKDPVLKWMTKADIEKLVK